MTGIVVIVLAALFVAGLIAAYNVGCHLQDHEERIRTLEKLAAEEKKDRL